MSKVLAATMVCKGFGEVYKEDDEMAKMRAMSHNSRTNSKGRVHGNKHNDRNFDTSKADNINTSKEDQNVYRNCFNDPSLTFEQAELRAYEKLFSKQLQETNENYIANRHPERCKTMEQFMKVRQYAPEESIYQVGKMEQHIDRNQLLRIFNAFDKKLRGWNKEHNYPFVNLSTALHADEAVPHVQNRRVWVYRAEDGSLRIGQEKALEQAGIPLPHPDRPVGRYNNRKMTFDKMVRNLWLDICHEHGIDIERTPVPDGKHNREKEEMIRDKYNELQQTIAVLEDKIEELESTKEILSETIDKLNNEGRKQLSGEEWKKRIAEMKERKEAAKELALYRRFVNRPDIAPLWRQMQSETNRNDKKRGQERTE